jgi:hypothetical protein
VCKGWHNTLADASLWTRLDLSRTTGGVADARVTDALLRGAAAKARGGLTALDLSQCPEQLTQDALLEVVIANAGALTELRACQRWGHTISERVEAILAAAPLLRVYDADTYADPAVACRMLRNEPPFGLLRVHKLLLGHVWPGGEAEVVAFAADMTASASSLSALTFSIAPLDELGALDAVVDAALARRLPGLWLSECSLSAASVPALARLLGGSALSTLALSYTHGVPLLLSGAEGSAALLAVALRANSTLAVLRLENVNVWHDAAAAETLLQALTAHPSVQSLRLSGNPVRAADRARAGAALGALVAAHASALEELCVSDCRLGDEGLDALVDALAGNTRLQVLQCRGNNMSDAFALTRLQRAVRANTSLRKLSVVETDHREEAAAEEDDGYDDADEEEEEAGVNAMPVLRQLEALVEDRGL